MRAGLARADVDEVLKENALRLADDHIQHCNPADCNISLWLLARLIEQAGIELTEQDHLRLI